MGGDLTPKYHLAKYDARYFQELFAFPDTQILPEEQELPVDDKNLFENNLRTQYQKKILKLKRMQAIQAGIKQEWFGLLESALMARVKLIESYGIWEAQRKGDGNLVMQLTIEREGIVRLFDGFKNISAGIASMQKEIEQLKNKADRPDDLDIAKLI